MREASAKKYLLALLLVVLAFNYVDRLALGLVAQDIKTELHLTDTQLGLLNGIAFALFYSVMGIPIARWADRSNRVTVISITTSLWSVAVALSATAGSFVSLLLIRIGVAVGEAGCIPPAHSLIADRFTRAERPRAIAIYMLGVPLSVVIGYFVAGWLNEFYGWRMMFVWLGLPGLVLAALARLTLSDPHRGKHGHAARAPLDCAAQLSLQRLFLTLWSNATFRHLLLANSVVYFFGYGLVLWQPAFFIRSHGLQTGELGTWLALIHGLGGLIGTWCGGEWATRFASGNERLQLKVMAVAYSAVSLSYASACLTPDLHVAFGFVAIVTIAFGAANGPLFATIQTLVPERMRATAIAFIYLFANLIGLGLGPLAAGALSDALHSAFGAESLRYALLSLSPGYLWGAWHLWQASRTVMGDLAIAGGSDSQQPESAYLALKTGP